MNFFSPPEVAKNYLAAGEAKTRLPALRALLLAVLAGAFIAMGGIASTTVSASIAAPSVAKFAGACVFPGGLVMVLLAGSELFTGNCLLVIPLLSGRISAGAMLRNWGLVYLGNLIGGLLVAAGVVFSHLPGLFGSALAAAMIGTAAGKCALTFSDALIRGILCNFLVCIAVWISFAAKDVVGKIAGIWFPVMMFVLCGFEHSVANMYFIGAGLFAKASPAYLAAATAAGVNPAAVTPEAFFLVNLLPVTLGNIIGGAICVGVVYWYCYLKEERPA